MTVGTDHHIEGWGLEYRFIMFVHRGNATTQSLPHHKAIGYASTMYLKLEDNKDIMSERNAQPSLK